jgi:hypothetical protein
MEAPFLFVDNSINEGGHFVTHTTPNRPNCKVPVQANWRLILTALQNVAGGRGRTKMHPKWVQMAVTRRQCECVCVCCCLKNIVKPCGTWCQPSGHVGNGAIVASRFTFNKRNREIDRSLGCARTEHVRVHVLVRSLIAFSRYSEHCSN